MTFTYCTVADPGFPVGGRAPVGGCGPLTRMLFSENAVADPGFPIGGAWTSDVGAFWQKCV